MLGEQYMIQILFRFLKREQLAYHKLSVGSRRLLISTLLADIAEPMSSAFSNAYLWRHLHSVPALVIWNALFFSFLSIGFGLNGWLMRRHTLSRTFLIGCATKGAVPFLLILVQPEKLFSVALLGALLGLGGGFYWGSRNLFTLRKTSEQDRLYYGGLESVVGTAIGIFVPFLVGSLFLFANNRHVAAIEITYAIFAFIGFLFLCLSGLSMQGEQEEHHAPRTLLIHDPSLRWKKLRLLEVVHGFHGGLEAVVPTVMILLLVGNEGALGFISSLSACIALVSTYTMGRLAKNHHRPHLLTIWIILELLGSLVFSLLYSSWSVLLYTAVVSLVASTRWVTLSSIMFDAVEQESGHASEHYAFIYDREIWLNVGRVLGLMTLLGAYVLSPYWTIRCALVGGMLLQFFTYRLSQELSKTEPKDHLISTSARH